MMAERLSSSVAHCLLPAPNPPRAAALPHRRRGCLSPSRSLSSVTALLLASPPLASPIPCRFQRLAVGGTGRVMSVPCTDTDPAQLRSAREDIKELLNKTFCHPILVRLGWHDAGTYNKNIEEWPKCGGANGSLRFEIELKHAANAGLVNALKLIQPIKDKYPNITYADLFQLASATAIEEAGGPQIPMKYGRLDVSGPEQCPEEGRLPDAGPRSPADHLRDTFYRMGLNDKEIVALSGAHTLGRSRPDRSGWGKPETKYTKDGPGAPGGQSWTVQWLKFDNSYFKEIKERKDEDLLVLPTDAALFEDPNFKVYATKYAEDQDAFFKDYAEAHAKLSNLGAKFDPPEGISIADDSKPVTAAATAEPFVAAKYSYGKRELSETMKAKIRAEYEGFGGSPDKPLNSNYFLNIMILIAGLAFVTSLIVN
ncbi:probable L-ascorbate peroxidase 6, chloroplastic/mitochondrial [Zingiber officinale]|uniref:probable L-ascorbate peroxidase 6, chloroplastic/mitochondrial n=1 Tax=Zingiber officinale TaxID=94328 RepID=UPI001C4C53A8|nr:probable L-ascorbate peroxidase 6, chloroplastic/mitochondrial [Zingiber officinale]